MFLKKIVISGFKSFADKIIVNLDRGITGVVGPNGSGKSNIIDSVRWVMGEQNAKNLRGEKATDIIFAGSERRKALGMAEVSLVFDNSENSPFCPPEYRHEAEIVLTRRLYADGQREYLINRKGCRLKDIVAFFANTGLGGRSYSMIQQGQVDRILNAKPEDVREILEEAAGTGIYKKRKADAEKKLEQTELNLSRIDDILVEVERQLQSLESQVEKAREWQTLSDDLKDQEIKLFAHNYRHFNSHTADFQQQRDEAKGKEDENATAVNDLEERHADLQSTLDEADPEIQSLQESISVIREKIARSESTLKTSADRIESGRKRLTDIAVELEEDDANLKVLESQVETARRNLAEAEELAGTLAEEIETFQQEVENADEAAQVYQGRMEEFEDEIRSLERLIENNKFRTESAEQELAKARAAKVDDQQAIDNLAGELETSKVAVEEAERAASTKRAGLDQEIKDKHDKEAAVAKHYEQIKDFNGQRDKLREDYLAAKARYTSLQEIEAGATDVAGSVGTLKRESGEGGTVVRGLLTDYIGFGSSASELPRRALAALETWSERVVVDGMEQFNRLVRLAHQHELGSLPVWVLSEAEVIDPSAAAAWADQWGAEPLGSYLKVSTDDRRIAAIIDRLYLLPALEIDSAVVSDLPKGSVVFTSQGVCLTGSEEFLIGGKTAAGLLSRKTEMEELAANLKSYEGELGRTQAKIDELELRINEDRQTVAAIDRQLQEQNQDVLEVMSQLQSIQQSHDRKNEAVEDYQQAIASHEENIQKLLANIEELKGARSDLDSELENNRVELNTIKDDSASLLERKEEVRRQHDGKRLELAKSESRAQAIKDNYLNTKAQLELLQNKLSRRYEERSRIDQDIEKANGEQQQAQNDIESFVYERETLEESFTQKRQENSGVIEELRVIDNKLRGHRDQLSKAQKALADSEMQLERVRIAVAGVIEQAAEKYKLDLATYEFEMEKGFNPESAQKAVSRLRGRVEGMGAINMMALKEFEEKTTRRDFITQQRDEVTSAIELLLAAISEIEATSLEKFLETFATINKEFGELFPILFPTGEGQLQLTDPENTLEAGIEIMCRLPGKSRKSMSLFSGGEKALTAMALIFALLKTKPTPFCFLDEVDAPLDEANVGRYNKVLEALSDQFQFIVITHNRRTMEVLDTLYGITMLEPGVSKCVGVDMQRDLPQHLRKAFKEDQSATSAQQSPAPGRVIEGARA